MIGCPNCGTPRESLSMSPCPECGHQIGPASEVLPPFETTKNASTFPKGVEIVWTPLDLLGTFDPASSAHPETENTRQETTANKTGPQVTEQTAAHAPKQTTLDG